MNKLRPLLFAVILISLLSCEKELSIENTTNGSDLIVGIDCRISKIVYIDTAGTAGGGIGKGMGSTTADINNLDFVTELRQYDSLASVLVYITGPVYKNDSVYINPYEYFIVDANKKVIKMHLVNNNFIKK